MARTVLIAGGGTAGHIEPALALADALASAGFRPLLLGAGSDLEARLVAARGHELVTIPKVPLPRRPGRDMVSVPGRLAAAVRATLAVVDRESPSAVVGFGGYVAVPAYLAGRRRRLPVIVHEANARAGVANRLGARLTHWVAVAYAVCGLPHAQVIGIPLRPEIAELDRPALAPEARQRLGLPPAGPVLLVTGGSQGARRINAAVVAAAGALDAAGISVLHHAGGANAADVAAAVAAFPRHVVVPYIERMADAYAAADLALCRAGAMTCAELSAVGLPAAFVPLPIGNGEQRLNAIPLIRAGAAVLVDDADLDAAWISGTLLPLLHDPDRLAAMAVAARTAVPSDAAAALVAMVVRASARMGR